MPTPVLPPRHHHRPAWRRNLRSLLGAGAFGALAFTAPLASPTAPFLDRAAEWGLEFRYDNGMTGERYYPEIIGGGAALFDFDNDGDLDVFLVQGRPLAPGAAARASPPGGRLFRNDLTPGKDGRKVPHFVDVTAASGIAALGYGMGVATGDYDNDGWIDLYVLAFDGNQLWHNNGNGTFTETTAAAGVGDRRFSLSASFADLDRDGWLDLYVANYVDFSVAGNVRCFGPSTRPDYCNPSAFPPLPGRLLRNRGNGTFADVSLPSGIASKPGRGMGVVADDLDGDGWPDLFVTNDGTPNFLWHNRHDFTFEEVALPAGVALNGEGRAQANMGIAAGDWDGDGDDDLLVTHIVSEASTLFVNDGHGSFEDRTAASGLAAATLPATGFGVGFLDYDDDGRLDLLIANGAVSLLEDQAARGNPYPYAQAPQLLRNLGGGRLARFADISREAGETFRQPAVGRGVAFGDVDNDGGMDALIVDGNGPVRLLMNQVGGRKPWLGLRLLGRPPGAKGRRDLLGARVAVLRRGAPALWRRAATDGSYASASDPRVLVGLGEGSDVTEVRVVWPDGRSESFPPPPLGTYTDLAQGTGHPVSLPGAVPGISPPGEPIAAPTEIIGTPFKDLLDIALDNGLVKHHGTLTLDPSLLLFPPAPVGLEPAVERQISAAEARLRAALAAPGPAPGDLAAAYGELGELFHAYRLAGPAADCYANAERLDPKDFRWPHLRGLLTQEAGQLDEAEVAYGRALERAPGDRPALVYRGEVRLLTGRKAEAEADLKRALADEPKLTAAKALLGQVALAEHRYEEAVQLFAAALSEVPGADRLHYSLGLAYRGLGDSVRAADHLARAGKTGVRPADPLRDEIEGLRTGERVHLARGKAAVQAGRAAEAAAEFRSALAARPESVAARINLASVLASQGDRTGALALLREAVRAEPANPTARFDLGLLLAAGGEAAAAREQLALAAAARPEDAEAHRALAQVLRDGGDLPGALAEYGRAVALAPADDVARLGEGETLVRLGRFQAARDRLEEGRRVLPESGLLAHGLARLLAGSPDPALRDGARALTLAQAVYAAQPSLTHAATVALALAELGRCAEAADWQKKALAEAARAGLTGAQTGELAAALARYEGGAPCRPPVSAPAAPRP